MMEENFGIENPLEKVEAEVKELEERDMPIHHYGLEVLRKNSRTR